MKEHVKICVFFFFSTALCSLIASTVDILDPTRPLTDGETLVSAGDIFVLGFFSPNGSSNRYIGVWYNKVELQTVVWVANRQIPITGSAGTLSISATTGSLIIADRNSTIVWSTPPAANMTRPIAQLLDNGNFVVREADIEDPSKYAWQGFDHPTDTMLSGMKFGWDLRRGLNRNLTSWTSASDPAPGPYVLAMDVRGDPETFLWNGEKRLWRTGPWDGLRLSGVPDMRTVGYFAFNQTTNADEVYYQFSADNSTAIVSRFLVGSAGTVRREIWKEAERSWKAFWSEPKDSCDSMSVCGAYGVCDIDGMPICNCLQGFDPKSPESWKFRDSTEGCVRRTALDCRNGTDGFARVSGAKPPDTTFAAVDRSLTLDQCRSKCMGNCSCTAYSSANVTGGGSGCIMWTSGITDLRVYKLAGQDLYVRLAAADLDPPSLPSRKRGAVRKAGIVIGTIVGALLICWIGYFMARKNSIDDMMEFLELPQLNQALIVEATNNYSPQNKLGEGGFGPVYMGKMRDGQQIAVKRLAKTSTQGDQEFKSEVMLIAKLQHRNLVRLLGCCIKGGERLLVYEYMENKSLDLFLFDKEKCVVLDWHIRHNIILGIARGLVYLHQDSRLKVIHRDLKVSNILLDKNMEPKISDFGLARIFATEETEANTRQVVGTYGYMSPEYAMDGIFSIKSDVFSFGVIVLEVITGKKNRSADLFGHHRNLLGYVWNLWNEGNGLGVIDESMIHSVSSTQAIKCIVVGLLCVQELPEDRPTMPNVMSMLTGENVTLPTPKRPGFVSVEGPTRDLSVNTQESLTISILEGR